MEQPLTSVIIVSYNHSSFLNDCLDSLLNQTYENWELIIADDCSKDNSVQIIENWLLKNNIKAKKIFHKENKGFCSTLNECITISNGKYLKIIAADDIMFPMLLEKSIKKLKELPNDYALIYSNAKFIDENKVIGETLLPKNFDFDRNNFRELEFQNNIIIALTVIIKKEIYKDLGLYNKDYIIEDYEYWLRLSKKYKVEYINEVLGYYRLHTNNISKKIDIEEEVIRLKILHDKEGKYSKIINENLIVLYKENRITNNIISNYNNYTSKNKILYFAIKYKIPFSIFKKFYKIKL